MAKNSLTITDNRTGKSYEIAIENGDDSRCRFAPDQDLAR